MFTVDVTPEITALVARLEALRLRLDAGATLSRRWAGRLRREMEVNAIAASTSLEGVRVTPDDVRRILAADRPARVTEADAALVAGYRDAMTYALRRADDPDFVWHPEVVRAIHDRVLAGSHALGAGRYRERPVFVVDSASGAVRFTPPDPELVGALLAEATTDLEDTPLPTPVLAALAHVTVAAIHPFADGNGRTARIVASLVMLRGGYRRPEFTSLEEWWGTHAHDYYAAFTALGTQWDAAANVTGFVQAHLSAHVAQVETYELEHAVQSDIWVGLENLAQGLGDLRGVEALYDAFLGRAVTNRYYREIAAVSSVTAASDLARLAASGLLDVRGAGSSTQFVASGGLFERLAEELGLAEQIDSSLPLDERRRALIAALRWRVQER
ncbi:MAG: Fic family protein [Coriobacteriia bacterium]|nr:Fic family protein [Coriobacteriia bacterium]